MKENRISQQEVFAESLREQDLMFLAAEFRDARAALGLTQAQLAERAGVGVGTIRNLESGDRRTQTANLVKILNVIDLKGRFEAKRSPWEEEVAEATIGVLRSVPEQIRSQAFADGLEMMATAPARYALAAMKKKPGADEEDQGMGEAGA